MDDHNKDYRNKVDHNKEHENKDASTPKKKRKSIFRRASVVGRYGPDWDFSRHFSEVGGAKAPVQVPLDRWRYSGHFGV